MARRSTAAAAVALTMLVAACDGSGKTDESAQPTNSAEGPATEKQGSDAARIAQMTEAQRNGVFIRAIRDAKFDCQHVDSSASEGTINGAPAWSATCSDGKLWTIIIAPGGNAQVVSGAVVTDGGGTSGGNASAGATNSQ